MANLAKPNGASAPIRYTIQRLGESRRHPFHPEKISLDITAVSDTGGVSLFIIDKPPMPLRVGDILLRQPDGLFAEAAPNLNLFSQKDQPMSPNLHVVGDELRLPASLDLAQPSNTLTMSSREIAELVDSRHDKVKQSIERLAERGVIGLPPLGEYLDSLGRPAKEYRICKRDSLVVVAQLCPEFTARVVDRWQELEGKIAGQQIAIPTNLREALLLAADLEAKREAAEAALAEAAPKVAALERIEACNKSITLTQAAKVLDMKPSEIFPLLEAKGWIHRRNGAWTPYQPRITSGDLVHKFAHYTDKDGQKIEKPYCHITPRGLVKLARLFARPLPEADIFADEPELIDDEPCQEVIF
ncbi:MAG: phage antirepressor KilAC domain-containing protein [Zoogloeaceae bacterium]|jgi:phage regulator Rha-like protein|nr:phage antirepressor KilAC domain-containing protein [Zoogloeaceae bacterium]